MLFVVEVKSFDELGDSFHSGKKRVVVGGLVEVTTPVSNRLVWVDVMEMVGLSRSSSTGQWLPSIVGWMPQRWL